MLSATRVQEILLDCFFDDPEIKSAEDLPEDALIIQGLVRTFAFQQERVTKYAGEIRSMLEQLPETFRESEGGGASFLEACFDKDGNHWAEHRTMEELFCLGMAADLVKLCTPRDIWYLLPGGVPFFTVTL